MLTGNLVRGQGKVVISRKQLRLITREGGRKGKRQVAM